MTRKRFIKKMMSVGISRNVANWAAGKKSVASVAVLAQIINFPDVRCITNVYKTRDGFRFRARGYADA